MGCSDADWASNSLDRKSISGYCFYFQGSLVSWSAVKQRAVALSSTEAEYYALTHAFKEALWFCLFLTFLHLPFPHPFPLFSDNQAAVSLSTSSTVSSCSKHIDVRHHFIHAHISDGSFSATWIPTTDMPADIFTKSLLEFQGHCVPSRDHFHIGRISVRQTSFIRFRLFVYILYYSVYLQYIT